MDLSIIIPIYNSENTIRECLLSILDSDFDNPFEIIVIDDGSTDKSIEKIKDLKIKIIKQENKGAATARNNGAKHAKGNLIIFVDSDVIFFKDTLRRMYEHLKNEDIAYISIRYSKNPLNNKWIHKYKALADYSYSYDLIFNKRQKQGPIRQVYLNGGAEGYKKNIFEAMGGFDENVKGAGIEREKLVLELSKKYNILADATIRTRHNFPDFNKLVKNYFDRTYNSMELMNTAFRKDYTITYLNKNIFRVILGSLTFILAILSIFIFSIFRYTSPIFITLIFFLFYILTHLNMFVIAFKENGFFFMLYVLIINLFFCFIINLAGFLGAIKNLFSK